jgi:heme exporter protein B
MWRDAVLVAGKDLRIEARSRVVVHQVAPFAVLVLVLFAFALGPDRGAMARAAPGLFWLAVLFCALLAVQRSFAVESGEGTRDGLRLSGLDPAGIFLGKTAAVTLELLVLEVLLGTGVVLLYGDAVRSPGALVATSIAGTAGLAAVGTLYGALSSGLRVRDTLLPLLLLPVAAPVLLAGTRAWQAALGIGASRASDPWAAVLLVFAAVYLALGVVVYGPLLEAGA